MATGFTMELTGIPELKARLDQAEESIQIEAQAKITDGAQTIARQAKQAAPVRYGALKNLISSTLAIKTDEGYTAEVISGANYSAYVEFGTGTKVSVPEDLAAYAIQFKGQKEVPGMLARPFFFPAAKRQIPIIEADIQKTLDKI